MKIRERSQDRNGFPEFSDKPGHLAFHSSATELRIRGAPRFAGLGRATHLFGGRLLGLSLLVTMSNDNLLHNLGFDRDPFAKTNADEEELLESYFIEPPPASKSSVAEDQNGRQSKAPPGEVRSTRKGIQARSSSDRPLRESRGVSSKSRPRETYGEGRQGYSRTLLNPPFSGHEEAHFVTQQLIAGADLGVGLHARFRAALNAQS